MSKVPLDTWRAPGQDIFTSRRNTPTTADQVPVPRFPHALCWGKHNPGWGCCSHRCWRRKPWITQWDFAKPILFLPTLLLQSFHPRFQRKLTHELIHGGQIEESGFIHRSTERPMWVEPIWDKVATWSIHEVLNKYWLNNPLCLHLGLCLKASIWFLVNN